MQKRYVFDITPMSWVRVTQNDRVFFRIPRDKLKPEGLKRLLRIERYNQYKISLLALAKQHHFTLPEQGASITFYIPVPPTWPKYKKKAMHLKLHQSKPDLSNCLKAFEDGLLVEDKHIAHYAGLAKVWINEEKGHIEVRVDAPVFGSNDVLA